MKFITGFMLGLALMLGVALTFQPASNATVSYNRAAAQAYANRYASNTQTLRNSAYKSLADDCTNYTSQVIHAGGIAYWNQQGLYVDAWQPYTQTWIKPNWLELTFVQETGKASWINLNMNAQYTPALPGDFYLYDWGAGAGWSHVAVEAGWGAFDSYYDSQAGYSYNHWFGGSGDFIDQHTTDRHHAPWNWGYLTQRNPVYKAHAKTVLIHLQT